MTYNDLIPIMVQKNLSPIQFATEVGITPQVMSNAKKRGGHFSAATMKKINDYLNKDRQIPTFEPAHIELIDLYSKLTESQKEHILNTMRLFIAGN